MRASVLQGLVTQLIIHSAWRGGAADAASGRWRSWGGVQILGSMWGSGGENIPSGGKIRKEEGKGLRGLERCQVEGHGGREGSPRRCQCPLSKVVVCLREAAGMWRVRQTQVEWLGERRPAGQLDSTRVSWACG